MIYLCFVRRCQCEVCQGTFDLEADEIPPNTCRLCGSTEWLYGVDELETRRIRMMIKRAQVTMNPGARSLKRQDQGKKQWRRFKPKEQN